MEIIQEAAHSYLRSWTFLVGLGAVALCLTSCDRPAAAEAKQRAPDKTADSPTSESDRDEMSTAEVYAAWYEVPASSLAKRRAGLQELTAAHNRLPLSTLVRVTHLENGKSVLVRITDRGITDSKIKIDLCKEAALELDMVSQGIARVRMEVVPDQ